MESKGLNSSGLLALRLALGVIMTAHGLQKVGAIPGGPESLAAHVEAFGKMGIPAWLAYMNVAAELLAGIGIVVGLLGRLAAFGIAVNMIVAIGLVHWKKGLFSSDGGFEFPLALLAMAIALMLTGMGQYSIDAKIANRMDRTIGGSRQTT